MTADDSPHPSDEPDFEPPNGIRGSSEFRALLNAAGGAIPFVGGHLAAQRGRGPNRSRQSKRIF
jgi:hypothetical protein